MDDLVSDFVCEAAEALNGLQSGLARLIGGRDESATLELLRRLHALKGLCAFMGLARAEALCHAGESLVGAIARSPGPPAAAALAPLTLITRSLGEMFAAVAEQGFEPHGDDADLIAAVERAALSVGGRAAAASAEDKTTVPAAGWDLGPATHQRRARAPWSALDTLARALGDRLGKRIDLVVGGDDIRIAPEAATALRSVLIALVRNACDHGVETPDERRRLGKPALSLVRLSIHRADGGATLEIVDDGRGVDCDAVRAHCVATGRIDGAQPVSEQEVRAMVFEPGVTTATALTVLSGRGVGLDLVRREIEALGGRVALSSEQGTGSRFLISLPASAIASAAARARQAA
jgi:chemotaxis protein histidine kinase CheA